jgi:hypothetical protein
MSPIGDPFTFGAAMQRGFLWASRFANLWMMETIFQSEIADEGGPEKKERAARLTKYVRTAVAEDFEHWHPAAVLIERCADVSIPPCRSLEAFRVDLLQWFLKDPRFYAIWSEYRFRSRIGRYDLYVLAKPRSLN